MAVAFNIYNEGSLPVLPYDQEPQDEKQQLIQNLTGLSMELVAENSRRVKESLARCQKETENTYAQCYSMIHDALQKLEKGDEDLFTFEQINNTIEQAIHLTKERTRLAIDLTRDVEQAHDQILSKTTTAIETASSDVMQTAERPSTDVYSQQQLAFAAEIKEIESKHAQKELAQEKEVGRLYQEFEKKLQAPPPNVKPSNVELSHLNPILITPREEPETDLNSLLQQGDKEGTRLAVDFTRDMEQAHDQILSKTTTAIETASSDVIQTAESPSTNVCSQQQLAFKAEIKEIESKHAQKEPAQEKKIGRPPNVKPSKIALSPLNPIPITPREELETDLNTLLQLCQIL